MTEDIDERPVAVVCVGMAGSGKTTFMQRINAELHTRKTAPYVINLDPAVRNVPFESNIDIRDSIDYREVMREYRLGPNGGILTSLNIFATKIDQILNILERRVGLGTETNQDTKQAPIKHIIVDTPGQIEVFVWSASGSILLDSLASTFPTVIAYIIDTPRTSSTSTFMSNMLYACSILYKTKLPMILVFNKVDVQDAAFATEWMTDFEAFQAALRREEGTDGEGAGGSGYMHSLLNSMSLMLEEFYKHLSVVSVSAMTGQGISAFFDAVGEKAAEFRADYQPELDRRRAEVTEQKQRQKEVQLNRMMKDMEVTDSVRDPDGPAIPSQRGYADTLSDLEDDSDEPEASFVTRDEDDEDADDETREATEKSDTLADRYRQALSADAAEDEVGGQSFARYLQSGNA